MKAILSNSKGTASPHVTSNWRTLRRAAASARSVVPVLPDLRAREDAKRVATYRRRFPHLLMVLAPGPWPRSCCAWRLWRSTSCSGSEIWRRSFHRP